MTLDDQAVLEFLRDGIDRALVIPVGVQLRDIIEYGVSGGSLPAGTRLPSIRTLAQITGLSAETVSTAYRSLQTAGVLVSYQGSGTFIAERAETVGLDTEALRRIETAIDDLIRLSSDAGMSVQDLATMVRLRQGQAGAEVVFRPVHLAMVGIFEEATQAYATDIASYLDERDRVDALTIGELRAVSTNAITPDIYVSLPSRENEVLEIVGARAPVVSISVIPSETTRSFLAALDPDTRLGLVARYAGFIDLMTAGAKAFAPHIRDICSVTLDDPELAEKLRNCGVVVYSTGAEAVLAVTGSKMRTAEYRHTPDPHFIRTLLLPKIQSLRAAPGPQPSPGKL